MTWVHTGKTEAFAQFDLNYKSGKELGITGLRPRDKKIIIYHQALSMLRNLPGYDQEQVLKEIRLIIKDPSRPSSYKHKRFFHNRIFRAKHPFRNYHYLIEYNTSAGVVIEDILFDPNLVGVQSPASLERTMMYDVTQQGRSQYNGVKTRDEIRDLSGEWNTPLPTSFAKTTHISVNGMQNDLSKAGWLMGVHTQAAYREDNVKNYTLVHNPTDGWKLDLVESLYDKTVGRKSHSVQYLASVVKQQANKLTKWTVHSQGAIIFYAALGLYRKQGGSQLNNHQLAVHGSGANITRLTRTASSLGIKNIEVRNNPFDLVANVAGGNNLSLGSLARSVAFAKMVTNGEVGASPHTLPFLGIETYRGQLQELGWDKRAIAVKKYIDKYCV